MTENPCAVKANKARPLESSILGNNISQDLKSRSTGDCPFKKKCTDPVAVLTSLESHREQRSNEAVRKHTVLVRSIYRNVQSQFSLVPFAAKIETARSTDRE